MIGERTNFQGSKTKQTISFEVKISNSFISLKISILRFSKVISVLPTLVNFFVKKKYDTKLFGQNNNGLYAEISIKFLQGY